ncbi:unnamed protein product [Mytilus edulis]|uniref:HYR domain-containing protein n=1 Tax=Mytilus edulis TaxID=6550 RepID=A0A8S3SHV0_MYTED|nr:unnamed protein product [Mytilus edulis]
MQGDRSPPTINNCPIDIYEDAIAARRYAFVTWAEPTAWDSKEGTVSVTLGGSNRPGDPFFEGSTNIGYYAKDKSGNMATCNFVIHINVVRCAVLATNIPDGYRICHPSSDMVKGTVCRYGCYQGHDLKGPSRSECTETGDWSIVQEPYCESAITIQNF